MEIITYTAMKKQLVLVEFNNCYPFIYEIVSKTKITLDKVVEYFQENEDFDPEKDSLTFIDYPTILNLD